MDYMEQALSLAKLAVGQVSPNPAVGAVIARNSTVIGQGYTQPPGLGHAEAQALKQAGAQAHGAVMYVTLEPCCYHGKKRTPPCTTALINAGITEVHMAMLDPNPAVAGRGKAELDSRGIKTYVGERESEAREVNEAYIKYITTGMPFVTAKFAISLDGKIATRTGDSKWISSAESRRYVHNMRYVNDAIMAGVNTVIADNPHLTIRCGGGRGGTPEKQPLRVIVDSQGRTPVGAQIFNEPGTTLLVLGEGIGTRKKAQFVRAGAEVLELPSAAGLIDLQMLLQQLGKRDVTSVLVEGGGRLFGSLFDCGLVDKVVVFISPIIIGGSEAVTAVGGEGADRIADSLRLERVRIDRFGDDIMVTGYPASRRDAACSPVSSKS